MKVDYEARFYTALKRIAAYMTPEEHRRKAEKLYGLDPCESMEMALENMLGEAKQALKGYRRRSSAGTTQGTTQTGVNVDDND